LRIGDVTNDLQLQLEALCAVQQGRVGSRHQALRDTAGRYREQGAGKGKGREAGCGSGDALAVRHGLTAGL
jgi:hypothetical protein